MAVKNKKGRPEKDYDLSTEFLKEIQTHTLRSLSTELGAIATGIKEDALLWKRADPDDLYSHCTTMLDISLIHYQLWIVSEKLRVAQVTSARNNLLALTPELKYPAPVIAAVSFATAGRHFHSGLRIFPFIQGKVAAVLSILSELTGIPGDLLIEFLGADVDDLFKALRELAEERKRGKGSPAYRRAELRLMRLLERIFNRLTSRAFRSWLIRKVGREVAERLLAKLAALIVPILGWIYFAVLFIGLLAVWWSVILDP